MTHAMTAMPKYESYKDSGFEWLKEVPSHWELLRLGSRFEERRTKVSDKDFAPLSVTKMGIVPQLDSAAKTNDGDNRKLVKKGDFVINSRSDRKGSSGIAFQDGSVSLINTVLHPKEIHPTYCNYLLKSNGFVEEFYRMGHGIVADLWTTRYDEMSSIILGIPTLEEQEAIAKFLDEKTAQIDQAIGIKEQQIALLKERKQIIIQNAVTKGLNPHAPMKDSGVDWIGDIPSHWETIPFKRICKAFGRIGFRGYNASDLVDQGEGAITLSPSNLTDDSMIYAKCSFLSWDKYYESPEIQIQNGDILIVKTGSSYGKTGLVSNLPEPATINPQLLVLKNIEINTEYFYLLISSSKYQSEIKRRVIGSTIPTISETRLLSMHAIIPREEEQLKIVSYITEQSKQINNAIQLQETQITNLKEYKASLINSAVTGKIKVI